MNQPLSAYNVEFNQLPERYGITQGTLSHRIKRLGLKTHKRGRKTYLTVTQLAKLDKLAQFFKENPHDDINEFLRRDSESMNDLFTDENSIDDQSTENLLLNKPLSNDSMINKPLGAKANLQLFKDEFAQFVEEQFDNINKQLSNIKETTNHIKEDIDYQSEILEKVNSYINESNDESNDDYSMDNQLKSDNSINNRLLDAQRVRELESELFSLKEHYKNLWTEKEKYQGYYQYWSRALIDEPKPSDFKSDEGSTWMKVKKPLKELLTELFLS